jgi:hypothetical protein
VKVSAIVLKAKTELKAALAVCETFASSVGDAARAVEEKLRASPTASAAAADHRLHTEPPPTLPRDELFT